jgi:anti-anti-sigma factor
MADVVAQPPEGVRSLAVSGEVDVAAVETLRTEARACLSSDATLLELDLSGVTFIDSTGLGTLVLLRNEAVLAGKQVTLTHAPPAVVRLLEITGLAELLADRTGA